MEALELLELVAKGESSKVQFKVQLPNLDSLAQELVAFSNSKGGIIIIGIDDKTLEIKGLNSEELDFTNKQLSNVANNKVFPPIFITTETITVTGKNVVVAEILEGVSKPYKDGKGNIYLKNTSGKRPVTSNEEISRLLQSSKVMYADEMPIPGSTANDLDVTYYKAFIKRRFNKEFDDLKIDLKQSLKNLNLMKDESLTLAGLLFFCPNRQKFRPLFSIQCVSINAIEIIGNEFTDNEFPFDGTAENVFNQTIAFIERNLKKIPTGDSFNSQTAWEIPYEVFEELIVNALVHRDYFISSTIKVFIFIDRIEIISPGKLTNSLTVENVISGISISRNPILQTMAQQTLPYKGLGTGVRRAISMYPDIEFINDQEKERFIVIIKRP